MDHSGPCGQRFPRVAGSLEEPVADIDTEEKIMLESSPVLAPPSVVVVGNVGERAIESLERSGLSVRFADQRGEALGARGPASGPGMILLDLRIPEQMLDMRLPEQIEH